ncbi:hypothetical protein BDP81DRAFT_67067 [Colletotrichum phormii]|uniref:C2H2-type domain-containing protein n=1 Tax=Colletotrichum phormii TaxID=359342 RepID=A0AAJ0ECE3_9PEZI|nr:uncharacterized protein BDP81DRAFT_67067 [Colletotrichum phormii]KAK1633503.1 hypothetical protein BDP81DRAFT_67067 [Colletotrichum phormii]
MMVDTASIDPSLTQFSHSTMIDRIHVGPEGNQSLSFEDFNLGRQIYQHPMSQSPIWDIASQPFSDPSLNVASFAQLPTHALNGGSPLSLGLSIDANHNKTSRPASNPTSNATRIGNRKRGRSQITRNTISGRQKGDNAALDELGDAKDESEDDEADAPPSKRLACPFYKFDRVRHLRCAHFHLKRVKDVKQHLLRKHRFHCNGCHEGFKDEENCRRHANSQQCQAGAGFSQPTGIEEGFSEDQVKELLQRMNSREADRSWYSIWEILFPGRPTLASAFLKSDVEEVISTVCELWEKNRSKVMSSLGNAPFLAGPITDAELSEQIICSTSGTPAEDNLLRLLGKLAEVSVPRGNVDGRCAPTAQTGFSAPALGHASMLRTESTNLCDSEKLQVSDKMTCLVKTESPGNARPISRRQIDRKRRSARRNPET